MARRCRRMVLLAFLTHVSLELCGFVGSWTTKSDSEKAQPTSVGVHAVDPSAAAALGAASSAISIFDFVGKRMAWFETQFAEVPLLASLSPATKVKDHAERLLNVMRSQQTIIPQVVELPEQPVEGTGFQRLMMTVLNDNRNRWSLCCACRAGGRQVCRRSTGTSELHTEVCSYGVPTERFPEEPQVLLPR